MIRTILADDHTLVRVGIRNALQALPDIEIVGEANNGPELLTLLRNFAPHLALIDVTMPEFDPIVMTRQICATYPDLKILIISAYDDIMYVRGLLAAGAHGYHLKDQPLSDLPLAVEWVLQGKRWISGPLVDKLVKGENAPLLPLILSARQRDILVLLKQGNTNQEIAERLGLSAKTVENHLTRLYRQLDVRNRLEAILYIEQHPELLAAPGNVADTCSNNLVTNYAHINLLIIDDNPRYRSHLRQMIARAYEHAYIYEAASVSEALTLVKRTIIHLAMIDVVLDHEDGIQCTRRLHALSPTTRIVLISAYPDREFHHCGLEAGACAFLDKKDLDLASLRQIIQDSLVD